MDGIFKKFIEAHFSMLNYKYECWCWTVQSGWKWFKVNVGNRYVSRGITMGTDIDCREGQTAPINVGCEIALFFYFSISL